VGLLVLVLAAGVVVGSNARNGDRRAGDVDDTVVPLEVAASAAAAGPGLVALEE
jgi:2-oxoglutarate dehydrogenase complex dehydrogenase (E1) component-like enzyme